MPGAAGATTISGRPTRTAATTRAQRDRAVVGRRVTSPCGAGTGPGRHYAFRVESRAEVDAFYKAAMAAGGRDNGAPGPRPHYHEHYYGAFVLDPDGNNVEAVCHEPE